LVALNLVYSAGAYPAGIMSDKVPASLLLLWGLAALIGADLLLGLGHGLWASFIGIGLWGVHMALTQGLLSKLVADHAPPDLRGSAFGLFNLMTGLAMLLASLTAGLVWDRISPSATFLVGAGFAGLAAVMVLVQARRRISPQS
jgi:MFS family permease